MGNLSMIELRDAEACLSELVCSAEDGEEVLITRDGRPAALLCGIGDPAAEAELAWEVEVRFTFSPDSPSEVMLCASID